MSADTPTLQVIPFETALARHADTEIDFSVPAGAAATAKLVVYVPSGYTADLGQAAGTKIADAAAVVDASGTALTLQGQVTTDTPAKYASDARAQACAPGTHAAVWVLQLPTATQTLSIPIFVDPTSGAETAFGSYKLQSCFASPYVPEAQGGAPFGAKVTEADLDFLSVFTNPAKAAVYGWRALVTPYTAGTATPNAAGTYELRSYAYLPVAFTVKARWDRKRHTGVISGKLKLAGFVPNGGSIAFVGGAGTDLSKYALIGRATIKKGAFTLRKKFKRTTYMFGFVPAGAGECNAQETPLGAPAGCIQETTAPLISNRAKLTVPKKK
jgi:hypothetical protein